MTGCVVVGPHYQTPTIDLPSRFVDGDATDGSEAVAQQCWRDFGDVTLTDLLNRGMAQNLDVRTATERINEAAANLRATGRASQITGSGSLSATASETEGTGTGTIRSSDLVATYVFDISGGVRRGQQQAEADLEAARFDVGTARLALLASLAGNYIDARY